MGVFCERDGDKLRVHHPANRAAVGFDITAAIRELSADAAHRLAELAHIDVNRIAFTFTQARKPVAHGMQASLTPLRFEGGSREGRVRGRRVTMQRLFAPDGREMLYILTVYLPRFMNYGFREKLVTVFHELWHISPEFNGDLRRHPGRCYAHSASQAAYDAEMERLVDRWLAQQPCTSLYAFLHHDFAALERRFGRIIGMRAARPRLLPAT